MVRAILFVVLKFNRRDDARDAKRGLEPPPPRIVHPCMGCCPTGAWSKPQGSLTVAVANLNLASTTSHARQRKSHGGFKFSGKAPKSDFIAILYSISELQWTFFRRSEKPVLVEVSISVGTMSHHQRTARIISVIALRHQSGDGQRAVTSPGMPRRTRQQQIQMRRKKRDRRVNDARRFESSRRLKRTPCLEL